MGVNSNGKYRGISMNIKVLVVAWPEKTGSWGNWFFKLGLVMSCLYTGGAPIGGQHGRFSPRCAIL